MQSFAQIRFPTTTTLKKFANTNTLNKSKENIVFQPFNTELPPITLAVVHEILYAPEVEDLNLCDVSLVEKGDFIRKVNEAIHLINNQQFKKIVLSRTKLISPPAHFNVLAFFDRLNREYPNTCNSLLFHENSYWIGASPELFLDIQHRKITLMSLAGTVKQKQEHLFSRKEQEEQEYVTHYIIDTLIPFCEPGSIHVSENKTLNAGPITHLLNEITGTLLPNINQSHLLHALHPTPAVGGIPKEVAVRCINQLEPYRDLYSGYLGTISPDACRLFVNLRCMQVFKDAIVFYAGCGITAQSNPEAEWEETELKMNTLLGLVEKTT